MNEGKTQTRRAQRRVKGDERSEEFKAMSAANNQRGFTLLEVMVAALVMGIAVAGVLSGLAGAARNASKLTDYDRATLVAKQKMDELLVDHESARNQDLQGVFDPVVSGNTKMGWRARITPFEALPGRGPGAWGVDRIELEIWWMQGEVRRSFSLEGFRRGTLQQGDPVF
jgi:prepilin-type N-terminal cleavage/methylation domain-containing protein